MSTSGGLTLTISKAVSNISTERTVLGVLRISDFGVQTDVIHASTATKAASLLVSTAAGTWAQLDNSGATVGQQLTYDPTLPLKMGFKTSSAAGADVLQTQVFS